MYRVDSVPHTNILWSMRGDLWTHAQAGPKSSRPVAPLVTVRVASVVSIYDRLLFAFVLGVM